MMKKLASLSISFGEVARVEQREDGVYRFLICDDDIAMREVNRDEMVEWLLSLQNVCFHSWNHQLAEDWQTIMTSFEKPYYIYEEFYGYYYNFTDRNRKKVSYEAKTPDEALEMFFKDYPSAIECKGLYSASADNDYGENHRKWKRECEEEERLRGRPIEV